MDRVIAAHERLFDDLIWMRRARPEHDAIAGQELGRGGGHGMTCPFVRDN